MLNKICSDLETSKKLKELKIEAKTNFYYTPLIENHKESELQYWGNIKNAAWVKNRMIPAYTLEQILEMLPKTLKDSTISYLTLNPENKEQFIEVDNKDLKTRFLSIKEYGSSCIAYIDSKHRMEGSHSSCLQRTEENLATTAARLLIKLKGINELISYLKKAKAGEVFKPNADMGNRLAVSIEYLIQKIRESFSFRKK